MPDDEDLRVAVYRSFATTGRAPAPTDETRAGLRRLAAGRHVVLDDDDEVVMAHPFSSVPLGFAVMGERTLWWGGCAWDAFAVPQLVPEEPEVLVSSRCPGCGSANAWVIGREAPPSGTEVAHFLVPAAHMWDDVVHTCGNQRLFCDDVCVSRWLMETGYERGYVMDLTTLWRLASHWYDGRLERGYVRREPDAAADYFREVGLSGPFWGLG